jgi:hypothetical protein
MVKIVVFITFILCSLIAQSQQLFKRTYGAENTFNQGLG